MAGRQIVRPAVGADGPRIAALVKEGGWEIGGLDWSKVAPYWLVAEIKGNVVGCLQIAVSRPIGYLEMLHVDLTIHGFRRAMIVRDMVTAGMIMLKDHGTEVVCSLIPYIHKDYKRSLKKRGGVVIAHGNLIAKSLLAKAVEIEPESFEVAYDEH